MLLVQFSKKDSLISLIVYDSRRVTQSNLPHQALPSLACTLVNNVSPCISKKIHHNCSGNSAFFHAELKYLFFYLRYPFRKKLVYLKDPLLKAKVTHQEPFSAALFVSFSRFENIKERLLRHPVCIYVCILILALCLFS